LSGTLVPGVKIGDPAGHINDEMAALVRFGQLAGRLHWLARSGSDVPDNPASPVRVVIVDDHDLFREGLRELLQEAGIVVLGDAATAEEAIELVTELAPDVVLMDLGLSDGMSGIEATRRLSELAPTAEVLVLTISADGRDVMQAILAGASGYLLKDASVLEIVAGVTAAAIGGSAVSPPVAARLIEDVRERSRANPEHHPGLTPRELQVLRLVAHGRENTEIAAELVISLPTVKHHISSILEKLAVENRIQAAVYAVRAGLV
jgi:two-component system NarL family response regulator